jgi:hypothetical protein
MLAHPLALIQQLLELRLGILSSGILLCRMYETSQDVEINILIGSIFVVFHLLYTL